MSLITVYATSIWVWSMQRFYTYIIVTYLDYNTLYDIYFTFFYLLYIKVAWM